MSRHNLIQDIDRNQSLPQITYRPVLDVHDFLVNDDRAGDKRDRDRELQYDQYLPRQCRRTPRLERPFQYAYGIKRGTEKAG